MTFPVSSGPVGIRIIGGRADFGFMTSSSALPTRVKARMTRTTQTAGGAMYHQAPSPGAPEPPGRISSWPQDGWNGSPRPMNARVVSVKIAAAKVRTVLATMRLVTFGRMCRRMMWPGPLPMTLARSTNIRSLTDSVWARMIRAVLAQLVMPMTTTITISVA